MKSRKLTVLLSLFTLFAVAGYIQYRKVHTISLEEKEVSIVDTADNSYSEVFPMSNYVLPPYVELTRLKASIEKEDSEGCILEEDDKPDGKWSSNYETFENSKYVLTFARTIVTECNFAAHFDFSRQLYSFDVQAKKFINAAEIVPKLLETSYDWIGLLNSERNHTNTPEIRKLSAIVFDKYIQANKDNPECKEYPPFSISNSDIAIARKGFYVNLATTRAMRCCDATVFIPYREIEDYVDKTKLPNWFLK